MSKTETIEGSDLRDVNVKADYSQVDDTWLNFGYRQVPIAATTSTGEYMGPSGTKLILQKSEFDEKQFLRLTMPQTQPFIPMEAVQYTVIDKLQNSSEVKRRGVEFDEPVIKESHYGNSRFWIIQTNIKAVIKGSHIEDDTLQLGFIVRNGYNTGVALGFDMCNLRIVCANGTIVRGQDFGTASIAHVGNDPQALLDKFSTAMLEGLDSAHRLTEFYESLTKLKINQKIAEHLYKTVHMPDKYFPDYINIELSKKGTQENKAKYREAKKVPVTLTADGKGKTMWEVFNDITKPLWHAMDSTDKEVTTKDGTKGIIHKEGINIYSVSRREQNLHRSMSQIMENRSRFN